MRDDGEWSGRIVLCMSSLDRKKQDREREWKREKRRRRKEKERRGQKKNEPLIARPWKNYNGGCLNGNDAVSATAEYISILLTAMLLTTMPLTTMPIQCTYTTFLLFKAAITREYHYYYLGGCRSLPWCTASRTSPQRSLVLPFSPFHLAQSIRQT